MISIKLTTFRTFLPSKMAENGEILINFGGIWATSSSLLPCYIIMLTDYIGKMGRKRTFKFYFNHILPSVKKFVDHTDEIWRTLVLKNFKVGIQIFWVWQLTPKWGKYRNSCALLGSPKGFWPWANNFISTIFTTNRARKKCYQKCGSGWTKGPKLAW